MNNLEETNRTDQTMKRGKARNLRQQEKNPKRNLLEQKKTVQFLPKKCRYLEWTEGRDDNGRIYENWKKNRTNRDTKIGHTSVYYN